MSEIAIREAEVVESLDQHVKAAEIPILRLAEQLSSLDWKAMKPPHTALLLMQKTYPVSGGGSYQLNFRQALLFATRCFELGVSPFSNEVWFDTARGAVNLTLEGKRTVARNQGVDLGPPNFEEVSRPWNPTAVSEVVQAAKKVSPVNDIGIKCRIRVGPLANKEHAEYTAYLSEWFVPRSPVWQAKPMHMLHVRAQEKALSNAIGTGSSAVPDDSRDD